MTRIAIVDDHTLFRTGIARLLSEYDDLEVVFEASNGLELQQRLPESLPIDVVLMDVNMPGQNGFEATGWIKDAYPDVKVLVLSMFDEDLTIVKMIRAGAGGYILKESKPSELYRAILEINRNGVFVNELVSNKLFRSIQHADKRNETAETLTARELEFLELCVSELTYKEIADKMKVAVRTVDNYRDALFEKLEVKSRVGLVIYAIRLGVKKL